MAIVRKKPTVSTGIPIRKSFAAGLELPTEKSVRSTDMGNYTWLIYGDKKIGKTSLVSHFPDCFCLMFEPGGKSLEIYQKPITDWEHFLGYLELLETTEHPFKTVAIDTGSLAHDKCLEYVCKLNGIQHPGGQDDYGASWNKVKQEFKRVHIQLMSLNLGLVVVAHATEKKIEKMRGEKYDVIVPEMSKQAFDYYTGTIDNICYYHYAGEDRVLTIRGDDFITAGTRCEKNFYDPEGNPIKKIDMGKSSAEAYENLQNAFHNKSINKILKPSITRRKKK